MFLIRGLFAGPDGCAISQSDPKALAHQGPQGLFSHKRSMLLASWLFFSYNMGRHRDVVWHRLDFVSSG